MTTKTRYFVVVSLLVLGVGFGTGLVAYYVGFPAGAFASRGGPADLGFVPRNASVIAYANVHEIMTSELRQKMRRAIPIQENGQQELQEQTGINLETDIDTIVACMSPDVATAKGAGMVLARGRFDETKIEALMREHGAHVETYNGKRLVVADPKDFVADKDATGDVTVHPHSSLSLSFMEPGLAAIGSTTLIKSAIDLHKSGNNPQAGLESVTGNDELMNLVRSMDSANAWAVGRFDALRAAVAPSCERPRPDSGDHLVRGQRPRQRRSARHAPRRGARRRVRQQSARRRARLPRTRQARGERQAGTAGDDAVARARRHRQDRHALVCRPGRVVRRDRRDGESEEAGSALGRSG